MRLAFKAMLLPQSCWLWCEESVGRAFPRSEYGYGDNVCYSIRVYGFMGMRYHYTMTSVLQQIHRAIQTVKTLMTSAPHRSAKNG
jgi:hypothetical protein